MSLHLTCEISEYLSTSYDSDLSLQFAWSVGHPPVQPFLEVTTYRAHIPRVLFSGKWFNFPFTIDLIALH